ncbi:MULTISPECIES: acyl-CoA thioesterase [Cellulomonas]|uniref:Thioesterase superfamily protein n=1 Tax=Cellulomonas gilvus (strain ATCC 13127 / NRRL B-14078) TaxID=593907 RepID=F8A3M7_CELGA|nr:MULTISPECIES: acyl-CoA thioesterase [Cellulomonas]AEI11930.1 thioesterase superfamily protein [Cellulomonas gilvus ATCC 13127]MCR6690290.1 thioesterase family protein [Cellulomonas sp.]
MIRTLQLATATFRPRRAVPGQTLLDPSVTRMRVHLSDLDLYRHVNNGIYLQCCDVARSNYLADLGAFDALNARGWYPVVAAQTIKYRRSLTYRQRFDITTTVLGWDERVVYLEQAFSRPGRDGASEHVARAIIAGRFLGRDGSRVAAPDVVRLLAGEGVTSPPLPDDVAAWARAVDVAAR